MYVGCSARKRSNAYIQTLPGRCSEAEAFAVKSRIGILLAIVLFGATNTPTTRDGSKDFNFLVGTWKTHYRLLKVRLANSHDWYDCYGTSKVTQFWDGSGELEGPGDLKCPGSRIIGVASCACITRRRISGRCGGVRRSAASCRRRRSDISRTQP